MAIVDVQHLLDQQNKLANRLKHLNKLVNSLIKDDCTRHQHTLDHYIRELEDTRDQANQLNNQVQLIMDQAVKAGKLERF